MAQLIIAAAGSALGGAIPAVGALAGAFGMTGGALGWMAGSMVGGVYCPQLHENDCPSDPVKSEQVNVDS